MVEPEEGVQRTALLQLSHGMSEYKERYLPFMEFMAEHGVVLSLIHIFLRGAFRVDAKSGFCGSGSLKYGEVRSELLF